ncbi:4Fe-4S binding protein [Rubripirellula reticaptiva]|uniref:Putative electron transport protein YccM n=1 Tax=Rubripirellula reticaptiva TaxID=2528013 RepID=A0A5C6ETJ5_9BACT|nr:4Fe-4S binding protein [Rubripirellula reticaptiva]TWU51630.1 putative electron transport protein YccM [Rubripirellula reticaptiva]
MNPTRSRVIAFATGIFGGVIVTAAVTGHVAYQRVFHDRFKLAISLGLVLIAASVIMFLTSFDRGRSSAMIRLDWFVPALRKLRKGQPASSSLAARFLRTVTPGVLQSDHATKRRGLFRKFLRRLGISWLASPVRRVVQSFCLLTFLTLFLYVCWPYSARPMPAPQASAGWTFQTIDDVSGHFVLSKPSNNKSTVASGLHVFVADDMIASAAASNQSVVCIGEFEVTQQHDDQVWLNLQGEVSPEVFDAFFTGSGSFRLYQSDPNTWSSHYTDNLASKEVIPAETFLIIDPLVSLSTAIASRSWVGSLVSACVILIVCVLIPRGFCGYLCPLGTTIDLFDWAIAGRTKRFRVSDDGWWVHIKYYLLAGTLVAAVAGVLVSGFFSAIPVITRAMLFIVDPLVSGSTRGWHLVPRIGVGQVISIVMFAVVLGLGFLRPRFWCKYVCPSGAVFSLGNLFRVTERKVESSCINCNKCVEICPFDAIKPDFTTRTSDCTMCQSCGGVCPTHAIKFVERWNVVELKIPNDPPTGETSLGRRGFLSLAAGGSAAVVGGISVAATTKAFGANLDAADAVRPVRPPGSVPEDKFLEMCIRCGECFKACPNNVLQPEGFEQGLEGLWAPLVNADWAGCESSCNACGQVCPTGAIRPLPLVEKKTTRMGLAIVNESTCLPFAATGECDLCVQECNAAGYHAIEYTQVHTEVDSSGVPVEGTGFLAPVVLADRCVGCGLCQTRCFAVNVKEEKHLHHSAIIVETGDGYEDRLLASDPSRV